jgi:hypothetical protein
VWLVGVVIAQAAMTRSLWRVRRLTRSADRPPDAAWHAAARSISAQLGLRRPVRLLESASIDVPMAGGLRQLVVYLPHAAREWDDEQRDIVLAHELAHLRSHDPLRHLLARVALSAYWFHPLAWTGAARASAACEASCDEAVLALGIRPSAYARVLFDMARSPLRANALAAVPMVRRSQLEKRLGHILSPNRPPRRGRHGWLVAGVLATAVATGSAHPIVVAVPWVLPAVPERLDLPIRPVARVAIAMPAASASHFAQAPVAPALPLGEFACDGHEARSRGFQITASFDDTFVCFWARDQGPGVPSQLVGQRGTVVLETRRAGAIHQMEVTHPFDNAYVRWEINGVARPVDATAEAWRARLLALLDPLAEERVRERQTLGIRRAVTAVREEQRHLEGEIPALRAEVSAMQAEMASLRSQEEALRARSASFSDRFPLAESALEQIAINSLRAVQPAIEDPAAKSRLQASIANRERSLAERRSERSAALKEPTFFEWNQQAEAIKVRVTDLQRQLETFNLDAKVAALQRRIAELNTYAEVSALEAELPAMMDARRLEEIRTRETAAVGPLISAIAAIR